MRGQKKLRQKKLLSIGSLILKSCQEKEAKTVYNICRVKDEILCSNKMADRSKNSMFGNKKQLASNIPKKLNFIARGREAATKK